MLTINTLEDIKKNAEHLSGFSYGFIGETNTLPLVLHPDHPVEINSIDNTTRQLIIDAVETIGAVLLRGFKIANPFSFRKFAVSFGEALADNYEYGSTPRSRISSGVYSSTEYPAHTTIPLHNEQSYTQQWPTRLWFHCMQASESGGETPLADSRRIFNSIPVPIRNLFLEKGLLYVRNFSANLDVPWQQVFNTDSKQEVEHFCASRNIQWQWKGDDELKTWQKCQSAIQHPATGEWVWFNQAHLFHASALGDDARQSLLNTIGEENLPRHVYFGDGSAIADEYLDTIRAIYDQQKIVFPWQQGDITMIDNLLVAHGRSPYQGQRKVIVAMAGNGKDTYEQQQ